LEEEIRKECKKWFNEDETPRITILGFVHIARHFADWQKQQMMKEAVVTDVLGHCSGWLHFGYVPECDYDFKQGDKVKLIIVKEG